MKKRNQILFFVLLFWAAIVIMVAFIYTAPCYAAWTNTVKIDTTSRWKNDLWVYRIKISCASDGADPDEFTLTSLSATDTGGLTGAQIMAILRGSMLYQVETDPGSDAPDAGYTLAFDDDKGASILDLAALSTTNTELFSGDRDLGFCPIIYGLQIDPGDIGSAGDDIAIYLTFIGVKK